MKKIILLGLSCILLLLTQNSFAIDYQGSFKQSMDFQQNELQRDNGVSSGIGYSSGLSNSLTFYKDFTNLNSNLDADFSLGSSIATFTASRDATTPATYIDLSGVIQLTTTSNVPRFAGGYYDTTGFHTLDTNGRRIKGLMMEASATNRATYSSIPEDAAWTKTTMTASNADAGSSSPDGTATSPSLTVSAGNGTFTQAYVDAVAGIYTASLWIKRKTGVGVINLRANTGDAYTAITASVLTTTWTRVSVASTSLTNPTFDLQLVTDTDAVYIWGCQLEKNPYMTSLIPCPTTALTRNAEVLKYPIPNNRTAAQETIAIQYSTSFTTSGTIAANKLLTDTDEPRRNIIFSATTSRSTFAPNTTDSAGSVSALTTNTNANTVKTESFVCKQNSPYVTNYYNGVQSGTPETVDNYISNVWASTEKFYIGCRYTGIFQMDGIVKKIAIFNRALSASEVLSVTNLLNAN